MAPPEKKSETPAPNVGANARPQSDRDSGQRRRFLRETLKGSVPFVLGWLAGRARGLARAFESPPTPRQTSPPPEAPSDLPPAAKQQVNRRYQEFARDNPDHDPFQP